MNDIVYEQDKIYIKNVCNFDLSQTLDCGQAFRWRQDEYGVWYGIADRRCISLYKENDDIVITGSSRSDFENFWHHYFDLGRDYAKIIEYVSDNDIVRKASRYSSGIRILNQEPWEALCSFIISQNNNIPRIKGIIDRLCQCFGEKIDGGYAFPDAKTLATLSEQDLAPLRCGFRAKYILDAARRVAEGEILLEDLRHCDYDTAAQKLMTIKGVGPKVADCVLLFGLSHIEAFPKDVWIKRALTELFDGDIPESSHRYAGIVQQYIFYYMRYRKTAE